MSTATRYSVLLLGLSVPVASYGCRAYGGEISAVKMDAHFPKFNIPPVHISYNTEKPPCRNIYMNIPLALKPHVHQRLQQLVSTGIIEPVTEGMDLGFCSSMITVPKGKNDFRLVIDLRGPNKYINRTPFTMPTHEKILAELDGATWFSTIDLESAFFHVVLDEELRHLTNFCTEFGMFRCVRLPFGLTNAPDIFQESLQQKVLGGCSGVKNYLDDILVYGRTKEEHDQNLKTVLARLKNHNVKLNTVKCVFGCQSVKFLGFTLTPDGWKIEDEKRRAIESFLRPTSCAEVKSFLGLLTFFDRFLLNRADSTQHLRNLAKSDNFY